MSYVVAIAGPVGAGKSTLAHALASRLDRAETLQFDSYEALTQQSPDELARWLRDGADFNALIIPHLSEDLAKLKRGGSIITPAGERVAPGDFILFEMPLGREHAETAPFIDLVIWIDLPPEVALARKLREFTSGALAGSAGAADPHEFATWLNGYLESYLGVVREVLVVQERRVRPGADLIVDGLATTSAMAEALAPAIRHALRPAK
jgi:uridine kinase